MQRLALLVLSLAGCSLYFGPSHSGSGSGGQGSAPPGDLYNLVVDHATSTEGEIFGVDADQQGGLWIAYTTQGNLANNVKPVVTLVHWDPTTRQRLQTFTYDDLWSPVCGLAIVHGQIWLNYENVVLNDQVIRVLDATSGAIVNTFGVTGIELSAMGSDQALISNRAVTVVDASSGGLLRSFQGPGELDPSSPMHVSFSDTQEGIAWRPGEIWAGSPFMPMQVYDDQSNALLGTIDLPALRSEGSIPVGHLAFDRGLFLVGRGGALTWYRVE
jgi:hypothetical protein